MGCGWYGFLVLAVIGVWCLVSVVFAFCGWLQFVGLGWWVFLWFWGFDAEFSGCLGVCFDEFWVFTWNEVVGVLWLCLSRFLGYLWDALGLLLC